LEKDLAALEVVSGPFSEEWQGQAWSDSSAFGAEQAFFGAAPISAFEGKADMVRS
jgi:hypothetical protein